MVHIANDAEEKDVQIMLKKEECALGTEHITNDAAMKGVQML